MKGLLLLIGAGILICAGEGLEAKRTNTSIVASRDTVSAGKTGKHRLFALCKDTSRKRKRYAQEQQDYGSILFSNAYNQVVAQMEEMFSDVDSAAALGAPMEMQNGTQYADPSY